MKRFTLLIIFFLILSVSVSTASAETGIDFLDNTLSTIKQAYDKLAGMVKSAASAIWQGVQNVLVKPIQAIIDRIPTINDIKNYIRLFIPEWAQSWEVFKTKLSTYLPDYVLSVDAFKLKISGYTDPIYNYIDNKYIELKTYITNTVNSTIASVFGWMDYDKNGTITYNDFKQLVLSIVNLDASEKRSGKIRISEGQTVFYEGGSVRYNSYFIRNYARCGSFTLTAPWGSTMTGDSCYDGNGWKNLEVSDGWFFKDYFIVEIYQVTGFGFSEIDIVVRLNV